MYILLNSAAIYSRDFKKKLICTITLIKGIKITLNPSYNITVSKNTNRSVKYTADDIFAC